MARKVSEAFSVLVNNELPLGDVETALASAVALPANGQPAVYTIVASRSHNTPETDVFIEEKKRTRNGWTGKFRKLDQTLPCGRR